MLTRLAAASAALVLVPVLAACGSGSSSTTAVDPGSSTSSSPSASAGACDYRTDPQGSSKKGITPPPANPTVSGTVGASLETTIGTLNISLDATHAPCTVSSFLSLAKQGFYDNTPCHRLVTRGIYVLQCGDPTGTGSGGPGYTIPDELTGKETYGAGTLAMANSGQAHSGGSQFFIVYKDSTANLGKLYTVFGKLDPAGVKAVAKMAAKGSDNANGPGDGHPKVKVDITKVTQTQ